MAAQALHDSIPLALPTQSDDVELWIGQTPAMQRVARLIQAIARADDTRALILGENGTGKELVAGAIHRLSRRASRPFVALNCGAIPANLAESELFGAEPGAFTDARLRHGVIERAHTGTLFLDEIGELPLQLQVTLLRFLETRRYRRLGGERELGADVRIIAATLRDLTSEAHSGTFRLDLLYRINVFVIALPPLRERKIDLPEIIAACLRERSAALHIAAPPECDAEAIALLREYHWPGNVRELRNVIERALILSGGLITAEHLPSHIRVPQSLLHRDDELPLTERVAALDLPDEGVCLPDLVRLLEDRFIGQAMERTGHNQSRAATMLGFSRDQLRQRLKRA